jgi:hypothetical protein
VHCLSINHNARRKLRVEDKYYLRITTEDTDRGLQAIALKVDPKHVDIATSLIRMISGVTINVVGMQQIIEDDDGVTHIKDVDLDQQKKIFSALLAVAEVEPTEEQITAMSDSISKAFGLDEEDDDE